MGDLTVNFLHPTDGSMIEVTLEENLKGEDVIDKLLENEFIEYVYPEYKKPEYELHVKGGPFIPKDESFSEAGVEDGDSIRVVPSTTAGGPSYISGIDTDTVEDISFEEVANSNEALALILRTYEQLQEKYENQSTELEIERRKSEGRFLAALLLIVAEVVLAIGANLLTKNFDVAVAILVAGVLQSALAIYLSFRSPNLHNLSREDGGAGGDESGSP